MKRDWRNVKNMIENEIDKIWWEKPIEFRMAEKGHFPSGCNVDGGTLGNQYFMIADTSNIGRHVVEPAIYAALDDDRFTVDQIKVMWDYLTGGTARLLGSHSLPNCVAPWLNLPYVWDFYLAIVESFDSIKTKDDFREVYYSWANYLTCLNRWAMTTFPWHLAWDARPRAKEVPEELVGKIPARFYPDK